ncbi:hypothetical protein A6D94_21800 [Vibrio splendidus]|nr:hypothetical protein A6D94_21800 [Vibrio splendidus]
MYEFSIELPEKSELAVWQLQIFLLKEAEARFGIKDTKKIIYQPTFSNNDKEGPMIMNRYNLDGAWAQLSVNSKVYWPCTLFELAHETVHLLNPVLGNTNYLEEGVAVAFSIEMSKNETNHPMETEDPTYLDAYRLVQLLPNNMYESVKMIRDKCGSLGEASVADLTELFPELEPQTIEQLCTECNFT